MANPVDDLSRGARIFMKVLGTIAGLNAVAYPLLELLGEEGVGVGFLGSGSPFSPWGSIFACVLLAAAAVELFTGKFAQGAGALLKTVADRIPTRSG